MSRYMNISPQSADRLAIRGGRNIRALRGPSQGQMSLLQWTHFVNMNAKGFSTLLQELHSGGSSEPEQIQCDDALRWSEHHLHAGRRSGTGELCIVASHRGR